MTSLLRFMISFVGTVLSWLPRRAHAGIAWILAFVFFDMIRIRRKVILSNIAIAYPNLNMRERIRIGRASMMSQGQILIEYFLMMVYKPVWFKSYFSFEGLEHLDEAYRQGRGVFLLTLHIGNGDFACMGLAQKGYKVNLITKKAKQGWLNDVWFGMRTKHGTQLIAHEKSNAEILKALKRNEAVIWVMDQYMGPPSGVKTTFFGKETGTARGMAIFEERTRVPVIPCYNFRRPDGRFHLVVEKPLPFEEKENHESTVLHLTQTYNDKLQEYVQKSPEQWMWIHRRWKQFG